MKNWDGKLDEIEKLSQTLEKESSLYFDSISG